MHVVSEGVLNDARCLLLRHSILDTNIKLNLETVNYDITNLKSDREFTVPPPIHLIEVVELKKLKFSSSESCSVPSTCFIEICKLRKQS